MKIHPPTFIMNFVRSASDKIAYGWSAEATKALQSMWGEQNIQSKLNGVVRNKAVYEMASKIMHR